MLCPEVWKFSPPDSNYKETFGSFKTTQGTYLPPPLKDFYYSHLVSVVLPNGKDVPKTITEALSSDCDYYKVENISLAQLISKEFVDKFVKQGSLTALSINTHIDTENCVCITPEGVLVLSLDKTTYQGLGLEGKVSHFASRRKERYVVQLNLAKDTFLTNKKLHERARQCLSERLHTFNMILSWQPPAADVCPSSVAKYLVDVGYEVFTCHVENKTRTQRGVLVPCLAENDVGFSGAELAEWLGMFSLEADLETGTHDGYVNSYEPPEITVTAEEVVHLEWRGLFTIHQVQRLYQDLTKYISDVPSDAVSWVSLYVQGFSDSPVAWKLQEHHHYTNGDNAYILFLQPSGRYMLCTQACSNKKHK